MKVKKKTSTLKYRRIGIPWEGAEEGTTFEDVILGSEWYVDPKDGVLYIDCFSAYRPYHRWEAKWEGENKKWWQFWKAGKVDAGKLVKDRIRDPYGFISELDLIEIESCCDGG